MSVYGSAVTMVTYKPSYQIKYQHTDIQMSSKTKSTVIIGLQLTSDQLGIPLYRFVY